MPRMQQRRKTAENWTTSNEQLLAGEIGLESDTGKWKVGDGTTAWGSLAYQPSNSGVTAAINAAINAAKANTSALAPVATAGTYASLTGKPTLGTAAAADTTSFDTAGAAALRLQYRGAWAASTSYATNDAVTYQSVLYRAPSTFTSGTTFTAANWTALSQPLPGTMATGYYYMTTSPGSTGSSAVTNGNIRLHPWVVTNPITITRAGAEVTAAGAAATVVRIGFYADNGGIPGNLILDAGTVPGDAVGVPEITGLSLTLQPGIYWVAVVAQGGSPTMRINGSTNQPVPMPVASMVANHTIACLSVTTLVTSGGLPATLGAWTAAAAHTRVYVKV